MPIQYTNVFILAAAKIKQSLHSQMYDKIPIEFKLLYSIYFVYLGRQIELRKFYEALRAPEFSFFVTEISIYVLIIMIWLQYANSVTIY